MDTLAFAEEMLEVLGYRFQNFTLLEEALTHPSCHLRDSNGHIISYQRLEFLGDSVMGAVVSELLLEHFPNEPEGDLARRKSVLVAKEYVASVVQKIGLHEHIRFSHTEAEAGGVMNQSVQEDVGEAVIGAMFSDGGYEVARQFVQRHWLEKLQSLEEAPVDAKTALQEVVQGRKLPLPAYELVGQEGAAHAPVFTVEVSVRGFEAQQGDASNKRKAEQVAAAKMLEVLNG